jgi:hypothetical protein
MQSDWGSAFPKQEINYVIAAQNTRASGDMSDLRISAAMPANLEVLSASASYGTDPRFTNVDPAVSSNNIISLKLANLKPGEQVIIAVKTRVKADVAIGTRIVSQAELTFTGIKLPAYSNIVTVLIVGTAPTQVAQVQAATVTSTPAPSTTASPSATATASTTATAPASPTGVPAPSPTNVAGGAPAPRAPLPETSTGVPIFGFVLLGMTMMLRTVRVHRAQSRL